jgi:hypothetical protein
MNRRNFFKIIAGVVAAPLVAKLPAAKADDPARRALAEYGAIYPHREMEPTSINRMMLDIAKAESKRTGDGVVLMATAKSGETCVFNIRPTGASEPIVSRSPA